MGFQYRFILFSNKFLKQVGLKNIKTNKYLSFDEKNLTFNSNGAHPFLKNNNNSSHPINNQEFALLLHEKQEYNGPIIFGSSIILQMK